MSKIVKLSESDLENIIKRVIVESDYSSDSERPTSDRERQAKSLFGDKYGSYIPNDVIMDNVTRATVIYNFNTP